jgi:hypothetical protein
MSTQPSRFITYPDILPKSDNHTVLLVDADLDDVANLATFCSLSHRDYDIYLYKGNQGDLEWLSHLGSRIDHTFIRTGSSVNASTSQLYSSIDELKEYFTKIDSQQLTNA